jgi:outer membrane protein OmpU
LDSGFSAGLQYADWDIGNGALQIDHTAVGFGYTFDAISVHMNYGQFDIDGGPTISGYGLAAAYDFGGGLSAHIGYGSSDFDIAGVPDESSFSFGLAMSF